MATKKQATTQKTKTTKKKQSIPELPERTQISEDMEIVAHEGGIPGALTILDNMAAMLDVMCNLDREQDSPDPDQLARVFFVLHAWTDFARKQISAKYFNENEAVA